MADASYIIDLILRARDDTAAAFASALGNQELFNKALDDSATQADKNAKAFQRSNADIQRSTKETAASLNEVRAANKEILDQQVVVEQAAKRIAKTQADQSLSQRERLKRQIDDNARLKDAQNDLFKLLRAHAIEEKKAAGDFLGLSKQKDEATDRAIAAQQELTRLEDEKIRKGRAAARRNRDEALQEVQGINQRMQALSRLDRSETARASSSARSVSTDRLKLEQLKEQERIIKQLESTSKKFADTQDARKAREFNQEIDKQAQALLRLGRSQQEIDDLKAGISGERKDVQFARERERIDKETAAATLDLQKVVDQELEKSRAANEKAIIDGARREAKERADNVRKEIAFERASEAQRRATARADIRAGKEVQDVEKQRIRDQESALKRLRLAAKGLADQKLTPEDFDHFKAELVAARQEFVRLGGDGRKSQQEVKRALDEAGASITKQHRARLVSLRGQEEETRQRADITRLTRAYTAEVDKAAKAQANLDKAVKIGAADAIPALQNEVNLRRDAARLSGETLKQQVKEEVVVNVDLDTGAALTQAALFEAVKKVLGRDVHINVDLDVANAVAQAAALAALKAGIGGVDEGFKAAKGSISSIGPAIRGLFVVGIIAFLNQIVTGATAAAGALVALAGSAFYAGGALAGGLSAGAAQAVPVLGLLAAVAQRFSKVIEAAKQKALVDQQAGGNAEKIARQTADAVDRVRSADEALGEAQRRQKTAQEGINGARKEATRQLQDLILAERDAELAAKGAVLSQKEAQDALQSAIQKGDLNQIRRAQLGVEQAPLNVTKANVDLSRTKEDLAERRTGEAPEIKQARENIRLANKAVEDARRASIAARRALSVTGEEALASAGKLNEMLKNLSNSEQRLYEQVNRLFGFFNKGGVSKFTDPITGALATVLERAFGAFDNKELTDKLTNLSGKIGETIITIFDRLTTDENIARFLFFIDEASKNLGPFVDILLNLIDAFGGIAQAASPIFALMLEDLKDLTAEFSEFVNSASGQNDLADFFSEGYRQLKSILSLLGEFGTLFLNIVNPNVGGGATAGRGLIDGLTRSLRQLNKIVTSPEGRKNVQDFFKRVVEVFQAMRPLVISVGRAIAALFSPQAIRNFRAGVKIFTDIFIPILKIMLFVIGVLTFAIGTLLNIPFAGRIIQWIAALLIFKKTIDILKFSFLFLRGAILSAAASMLTFLLRIPLLNSLLTGVAFAARRALIAIGVFVRGAAMRLFWLANRFLVAGATAGRRFARALAGSRLGVWITTVIIPAIRRVIARFFAAGGAAGSRFLAAFLATRFGAAIVGALSTALALLIPTSIFWGTAAGTAFGAAMAIAIPAALAVAAAAIGFAIGSIIRSVIPGVAEITDWIGEKIGGGDEKNREQNEGAKADAAQQEMWDRQRRLAKTPEFFLKVTNQIRAKAGDPPVNWSLAEAERRRKAYQSQVASQGTPTAGSSTDVPGFAMPEIPKAPKAPKIPQFKMPNIPGVSDPAFGPVDAGNIDPSTGKALAVLSPLLRALDNLTKDGGVLQQITEGIENFINRRETKARLALFKINKKTGDVTGGGLDEQLTALSKNVATNKLAILKYQEELKTITDALKKAKIGRDKAKTDEEREQFEGQINALEKALLDAQSKIADTAEKILQDKIDMIQKTLDRALDAVTATIGGKKFRAPQIDALKKVADALGLTGLQDTLSGASIDLLKGQAAAVKKALDKAKKDGLKDEAKKYQDQLDGLNADIIVAISERLNQAIAAVNDAAAKRANFLGLLGRVNDLREKTGDRLGAAQGRIGISQANTASLQATRAGLLPLLAQARQQGTQKAVEDLTAQIQELDVSILESNQTTQDLIVANRQLSIDLLKTRIDRVSSLLDSAKSIAEKVQALAGQVDPAALIKFAQEAVKDAVSAGASIAAEVQKTIDKPETFGAQAGAANGILSQALAAFKQGPQSFSDFILANRDAIADFAAGLGDNEQKVFNDLIDSMTNNTIATLDATQALQDLQSSVVQTFQSSAWQQFRQALFDGSGGIMPTFSLPSFDSGGEVLRAGVAKVHPGDIAVKGIKPGQTISNVGATNLHIEVNEAGQPTDVNHLANRLAFELRTLGNKRR